MTSSMLDLHAQSSPLLTDQPYIAMIQAGMKNTRLQYFPGGRQNDDVSQHEQVLSCISLKVSWPKC